MRHMDGTYQITISLVLLIIVSFASYSYLSGPVSLILTALTAVLFLTLSFLIIYKARYTAGLSELRFKALFHHYPDAVFSCNPEGVILDCNPAVFRSLGYRPEELRGISYLDLVPEQYRKDAFRTMNLFINRKSNQLKMITKHREGHPLELRLLSVSVPSAKQNMGIYIIVQNMTSFNAAKRSLELTRQELRNTLQLQQGMTFKCIKQGEEFIYTFCDGELMYRMGFNRDQFVGKRMRDLYLHDNKESIEQWYELAWQGSENITYEAKRNGIQYMVSLRPVLQDGKVQEVIGTCMDITERKRMEEELRETKELLESIIQNTADGILVVDREAKIIRANNTYLTIFGIEEKGLAGSQVSTLIGLDEDYFRIVQRLSEGDIITDFETTGNRTDGTSIDLSLTVSLIRDRQGTMTALAAIYRDITERKKTDEFLRKSDKLSAVGQLAAGLAHEIRNPLTSLKGFTQLLKKEADNKLLFYDIMLSELERINSIVTEFLLVAKPQPAASCRKSINVIIQDVVSLMDSQAILNDVRLLLKMNDHEHIDILCSEVETKQVFVNIIKNAIEAMPGGGEVNIHVFSRSDKEVIVQIQDQGAGIPKEKLRMLGEPFYTTKESGTGLGLMMCYKIVRAHQGEMHISSEEGAGTTVEVVFPTMG